MAQQTQFNQRQEEEAARITEALAEHNAHLGTLYETVAATQEQVELQ